LDRGELRADALRTGRPSDYTPELANQICDRLAAGQSLREICRDDDMPHESTVRKWAVEDREGFYTQYARAREAQTEYWADEIVAIADDSARDSWTDENGVERVDHDHISRSRLRVDTRKWLMSKLAPKKYGDRVTNEHTGEVSHRVVRIERVIMPMPVVERDDRKLI